MNKLIYSLTLALVTACPLAGFGQPTLKQDPAYLPIDKALDLKALRPEVNVNLPRFLLQDAISGLSSDPGSPLAGTGIDLADLLKDVKLIRVVVIQAHQQGKDVILERGVKALRAELDAKWTPVVSVPEGGVGVYAMGNAAGDSMAGLAVLVYEKGSQAVIGNIVGRISIGKLLQIATRLHGMPKGLLKRLGAIGGEATSHSRRSGSSSTSGGAKKAAPAQEGASKQPAEK